MKIVIPMAGHSNRFQQVGYDVPKPFINIRGIPMIQWVVNMFAPEDHFYFIVKEEHCQSSEYLDILYKLAKNVKVIPIEAHSKGPVYTSLAASDHMDAGDEFILSYCDLYQHWDYERFLLKTFGYDGGIASFRGCHPASFGNTHYAYMRVNDFGEMLELREKQSFTSARHLEPASTGVYYFARWDVYSKYANYILDNKIAVGSEYYSSLVYNPMVKDGLKVITSEVDRFICWGTPEDLHQFLFWQEVFSKDLPRLFKKECFI